MPGGKKLPFPQSKNYNCLKKKWFSKSSGKLKTYIILGTIANHQHFTWTRPPCIANVQQRSCAGFVRLELPTQCWTKLLQLQESKEHIKWCHCRFKGDAIMPKRLKNFSKMHKLFQSLTTLSIEVLRKHPSTELFESMTTVSIDKLRKSAALSFHDNFPDRILYCWCSTERENELFYLKTGVK